MKNPSYDPSALRQKLAERGIRPDRDPADYPASAEIVGMTPAAMGHDRFAMALHRLRAAAEAATSGDYALVATRDPVTHERTGYAVWARQQATADLIAASVAELVKP